MIKTKSLIIIGDSAFAQIAYEYFQSDSEYEVQGFAVEAEYLKSKELMGLKVFALECISETFIPEDTYFFVAITYGKLNRTRTRIKCLMESQGFLAASYISSKSFIASSAKVGDHCFIFEDNTVQSFCEIDSNTVLWSGNHIGHHTKICCNVFISSHVVVSGFCNIGENSFLGVNSTIGNNVHVGNDNWIEPGVVLLNSTEDKVIIKAPKPEISRVNTFKFFKIKE